VLLGAGTAGKKINDQLKNRLIALIVLLFFFFFILLFRLVIIQLIDGSEYREKSVRVIRKVVTFSAPRGEMFDRHYQSRESSVSIVSNSTNLTLVAIPGSFSDENDMLKKIELMETLLGKPIGSLQAKIPPEKRRSNEEIMIIDNLTENDLTKLADFYLIFTNFIIRQNTLRKYDFGTITPHVTGYVGPPTVDDLRRGIKSNQWVGKNGLEKQYDDLLRGEDGEIVQIKTAIGEMEEQKVYKNFIPGNNLILTVDMELQKTAWEMMGDRKGGVIVIKPATGEVLVLISKPEFDPNILIDSNSEARSKHLAYMQEEYAEINRAISAKYPPASTFKPLVAIAGIEERKITVNDEHYCPGKFVIKSSYAHLPDSTFHCWTTHGKNNLIQAIANSCSVYFYKIGQKIGVEPIVRYSKYFMLDQLTGIDLPAETAGFIPTPKWKEKQFKQRWFDGDTVNLSIGQGFIETTLISMVNFYAAIVNGGVVYRPHMIKEIRFAENDEVKEVIEPEILYELPISQNSLDAVRKGLREVARDGTASRMLGRPGFMPVAGKTGTAQTRSYERFAHKTQHAWFVGYGPYNGDLNNTIVVGVFVEQGVAGAVSAVPIAYQIFNIWGNRVQKGIKLD